MKFEEFRVCGIYCIENKINGKKYIGQSVNIQARFLSHKYEANNSKQIQYNYALNRAIRKYGIENFQLSILEECENLSEKEKFYIEKYNTLVDGYNMTEGGEVPPVRKGEENGRSLLTEEDVIFIRTKILEGYQFREVYPKFQDKISERGMQHIWYGTSWQHIMPEIYNDRKELFKNSKKGTKVNRKISNSEYNNIIKAKKDGFNRVSYWRDNFKNKISLSSFNKYWYEQMKRRTLE